MLNNQSYTVQLSANDLETLIKSLSASNVYHKDLDYSCFSEPDELQQIINKNKRLQSNLKSHLGSPFCPCPPETSDTAAIGSTDDVDGGIFSIVQRLKQIKEEINQLNGSAFEKSLLSDAQHYQLLDVEMFIGDFVSRASAAADGFCDCGSPYYRDDLGSCYDCFFPSDRGEQ